MSTKNQLGVSIVVCCHNSEDRLPKTLSYLQKQKFDFPVNWEVIIINNASIDQTKAVARSQWDKKNITSLRIVDENRLGLTNARLRGLGEAKFEFVNFIDDDNWVAENWVSLLHETFNNNPKIGACGGLNTAVFEEDPPKWFHRYQRSYAVGKQAEVEGNISNSGRVLFGAGLSIRKSAWMFLSENGFEFNLADRKGSQLLGGGDYELCLAVNLSGWEIWYCPGLTLQHFIPKQRLTWMYLRKLLRGAGASDAGLFPYYYALSSDDRQHSLVWLRKIVRALLTIAPKAHKFLLMKFREFEADSDILELERALGLISVLSRQNFEFDRKMVQVKTASWNRN